MEKDFRGMCGAYCGTCEWKEKTNCQGCQKHQGEMFWGTCSVAKCAIGKGLEHCGNCEDLPCDMLKAAFNNTEHGDNGERLANLKAWSKGEDTFVKLGTFKK